MPSLTTSPLTNLLLNILNLPEPIQVTLPCGEYDRLGNRPEINHVQIFVNDDFVALVPSWAVWPFETLVVSRRPAPHLSALGTPSVTGGPTCSCA